ncbi:MAG: MFS transporter [Candidatus Paralactobacillus gallistercoris]|uniref:MFS transporter n=1 Tax=Candidatus Paralactobacillus gallistercoris TaxID=2838724 RepID=A0A948TJ08_9LACO|nr:MFS transporter [Candidatus Paralactobacillus gallistercoris]
MQQEETKQNTSWWVLIAIGLGVFMAMLDVTIVNVALPTIQREFNANYVNTQWVVNAYTTTYTVAILVISKLGDMYGKKRFFLLSLAIFTLGSLFCVLSPNDLCLNLARGFEGIGGAGILGLSMALIGDNYHGKQRAFILGIWGSIVGFGTSIGPLVGGFLVQYFNWRSIFMINLPFGIIALLVGAKYITEKQHPVDRHLDIVGMILSTVTVFCIIWGMLNKENDINAHWYSLNIMGWLVAGVIMLILFIIWELHQQHPMMDLTLFARPTFVGACLAGFTISMGLFSFFTYLTILLQDYMGYSPLNVGLQRLIISLFPLLLGPLVGRLIGQIGTRYVTSGALLLTGIGTGLMLWMLGYHTVWTVLIPAFIFMGLGNAAINPGVSNAALLNIKPQETGMASGINNVFRQFGNCFGIVWLGLIVSDTYKASLQQSITNQALYHKLVAAGPFSGMSIAHSLHDAHLTMLIRHAYYNGMHNLLIFTTCFFVITAIITYFLIRPQKHH